MRTFKTSLCYSNSKLILSALFMVAVLPHFLAGPLFAAPGEITTYEEIGEPFGVAFDSEGNLYVIELPLHRVVRIDAITRAVTAFAGNGTAGFSGDGGMATEAQLDLPFGIAVAPNDDLYIADSNNHRIRRVDAASGEISTYAGTGATGFGGDEGDRLSAIFNSPLDVTFDSSGRLYIADHSNHRIRRVDATSGTVTTFAGNGTGGYNGDLIAASEAQLNRPFGITVDGKGNLFIADTSNDRIRRVDGNSGIISTYAGTGIRGYSGDEGAATDAQINYPAGLCFDGVGNLFLADQDNHRIRRVDAGTGIIDTVAGNGMRGFSGDGGPASDAQLFYPYDVAFDSAGHLFIADPNNNRVRRVEAAGELAVPLLSVAKPRRFPRTKVRRSSPSRRVAVRNTGTATLNGLALRVTGRNRRDFRVKGPMARTLAAGGTTTFSATFRPKARGKRSAFVTVFSSNGGKRKVPLKGKGK